MNFPLRLLLAATVLAVASQAAAQGAKKAKASGGAIFVPASEAKFTPVPGFDGVQMAALQGDPAKGSSRFLLKFAPGFKAPVHHHSANHYVTVVSGTLVLDVDGKEHKLPPGSYVAFTGKKKHATRCEPGAECVLAMDVRGKWDVVPEK